MVTASVAVFAKSFGVSVLKANSPELTTLAAPASVVPRLT